MNHFSLFLDFAAQQRPSGRQKVPPGALLRHLAIKLLAQGCCKALLPDGLMMMIHAVGLHPHFTLLTINSCAIPPNKR